MPRIDERLLGSLSEIDERLLGGFPEDEGITEDENDDRYAWYMGRRFYLGPKGGQVSNLFWLLAKPLGRARLLPEIQQAVDGFETSEEFGHSKEEIKKASQRSRKTIAKLRERLRERDLEEHLLIVRGGGTESPEYTMIRRFARNR